MPIQKEISHFIQKGPPPRLTPRDSVQAALQSMSENSSSCVLVVDNAALVGIFTARDFLNRVAAAGRTATDTSLAAVMTPNPETLAPTDSVAFAINKMAHGGYRNVPIMKSGEPVGVLTVRDIVAHLSDVLEEVEEDAGDDSMWVDIGGAG